jgi:P27 family predicted phage terminase small subunit
MPRAKPTPKPKPLPPPAYLSAEAAQIWRDAVGQMATRGTVEIADGPTIETSVVAVERQRRITAEIAGAPLTDEEGKVAPLLRFAGATAATVKNLATALGLNPLGRQRLPKAPQRGGSKWDDLV